MSFLPHSVSQGSYKGLPRFKEKQRSQLDRRKPASQFKKSKWDRRDIGQPPLEKHHRLQHLCLEQHPSCMSSCMYETGVPVSPTHKRLVKADGFHSTEET